MKPTVGIIGGSGPLATVDIERKILFATQKILNPLTDQDYFNLVVFNYCGTYDRNDSVFFGRPDPLNQFVKYVSAISNLGVDLIFLACNTAHMYLPHLQEKTEVPIISIIEKTLAYIQVNFTSCSKVGLISTKATQEKKLYHDLFSRSGIDIVDISSSTQDSIMQAIYLIKAGVELSYEDSFIENTRLSSRIDTEQISKLKSHPYKQILLQQKFPNPKLAINEAIEELKGKGCRHIIFGCTELPLVIPYLKDVVDVHFIDPNTIIAEAIIEALLDLENQAWSNVRVLSNNRRYL